METTTKMTTKTMTSRQNRALRAFATTELHNAQRHYRLTMEELDRDARRLEREKNAERGYKVVRAERLRAWSADGAKRTTIIRGSVTYTVLKIIRRRNNNTAVLILEIDNQFRCVKTVRVYRDANVKVCI